MRLLFLLLLFLLALPVLGGVPATFTGIGVALANTSTAGWSTCRDWSYAENSGVTLGNLFANCTSPNWVLLCYQVNTGVYDVLAQVDWSFYQTLNTATPTPDNGAFWYKSISQGTGVTESVVNLQPCDIDSPGLQTRLCFSLGGTGSQLVVGGRCGGAVALGAGDGNYRKRIMFDPCRGKADGTVCNDNDLCTTGETCQSQVCVGTPLTPPDLGQCYNTPVCDPITGTFSAEPRPDGVVCSDNNNCTIADQCQAGVCIPGAPLVCPTPPGQCFNLGVCQNSTGECTFAPSILGTPCDDGLFCTISDVCDGNGTCITVQNRTCNTLNQCRLPGYCDELLSTCIFPIAPDHTSCFLNNPCVNTSSCVAGVCTANVTMQCPPNSTCLISAQCNPLTLACDLVFAPDGTVCSTGNLCLPTEACASGMCLPLSEVSCTSLGQCYEVGACNPMTGLCSNPFSVSNKTCTDGDACSGPDLCDGAGSCIPGPPVTCPAIGQCDNPTACNPSLGCLFNPKPNGTPCNSGSVCYPDSTCQSGNCDDGPIDQYNEYCFPYGPSAAFGLPCIFR